MDRVYGGNDWLFGLEHADFEKSGVQEESE